MLAALLVSTLCALLSGLTFYRYRKGKVPDTYERFGPYVAVIYAAGAIAFLVVGIVWGTS